jgi:general transcription factor IIIA
VYLNSQCATCKAPLDNSEQVFGFEDPEVYCTRNREAGHLPVGCLECDAKYPSLNALRNNYHTYYTGHYSFRCGIPGCSVKVDPNPFQVLAHFRNKHPNEQYRCAQCNLGFTSHNGLDQHGCETMHAAYRCRYPECGSESTRIADLKRHQLTHRSILKRHACPHCRK